MQAVREPVVVASSIAPAQILEDIAGATARAPSIHNTQPWRFRATSDALELYADHTRWLRYLDPDRREMLISCGAALFGLRLGIRRLGYHPITQLVPGGEDPDLLARVRLGPGSPFGISERAMWNATRGRHTHRGGFTGEPLPPGLLTVLQRQAEAEGSSLAVIHPGPQYERLAALTAAGDKRQRRDALLTPELRAWTRPPASPARDGVSARAYASPVVRQPDLLPQRDFDLGRGWGRGSGQGGAPAATAVLITSGDTPADWLRAGQALYRMLLRAAADWVFASLHTQALEIASIRTSLRTQLHLPGAPQMVMQLGRARAAVLTPRRPPAEIIATPVSSSDTGCWVT
jgi:hypothetical protein